MKNYMEEQVVSFKTALLAKEVGFDVPVVNQYIEKELLFGTKVHIFEPVDVNTDAKEKNLKKVCSAPTQCLLQKWLREKHNIEICIVHIEVNGKKFYHYIIGDCDGEAFGDYTSYEDALEEGLYKALTNLKEKLKK